MEPQLDDDGTPLVEVTLRFRPDEGGPSSESFWARQIAEDVFVLKNVPFFAYDVNFDDAVRADRGDPSHELVIRDVVRRSGFQTLRVMFDGSVDLAAQTAILEKVLALNASAERATSSLVAVSVRPTGDYDGIFTYLSELEADGVLQFEETRGIEEEHPRFSR